MTDYDWAAGLDVNRVFALGTRVIDDVVGVNAIALVHLDDRLGPFGRVGWSTDSGDESVAV